MRRDWFWQSARRDRFWRFGWRWRGWMAERIGRIGSLNLEVRE